MILLDAGNSQVKAQFHAAGRVRASFGCSYRLDWETRLAQWLAPLAAERACQCSVLDAVRQARLDACLAARFGGSVRRFESAAQALGVVNGYAEPERLGADRWMALLGAAAHDDTDCIVIDAGSAITLDLLRADGQHLGGAILPGLNTPVERFREIFAHIDFEDPRIADHSTPGSSTEAAIQIDYGHHSLDRLPALVHRWMLLLADNAQILLAGGDAPRVQRLLERPARIVPDLVFRGMLRLARQ